MSSDAAMTEGGAADAALPAGIPRQIGQYRLLRLLGQGGMGSVFEAEQERPRRRVALKLMRSDAGVQGMAKRFELESAALARLQHPGIAQVFETGAVGIPGSGPLPFFVMELVQGVPLTSCASQHELSTRERLALVIKLCDAVSHAHQRGIIHRDLKPGNILVDAAGQPKILDFGIARITDSDILQTTVATGVGQILGTMPYMSPEQAAGDPRGIDARSDVYSLGVVCYELLVGFLPLDLARKLVHEAVRTIREDEPKRLSSFDKTLRGDVETIVGKALEKDRTRRYQSAGDFASDLQRYLDDEPIVARPAGAWYQLSKFARRNRILVGGVAATFLTLAAGLVASTILLFRADAERLRAEGKRKEAETQAERASSTLRFIQDMLTASNPQDGGKRDVTLREVTDRAARDVEGSFEGQPELEATLLGMLGGTNGTLDRPQEAERLFERALKLVEPLGREADPARADLLNGRGVARLHANRFADALVDFEAALRLLPAEEFSLRAKRYRVLENWGNAARRLGRDAEVTQLLRDVLRGRVDLFGAESLEVARSRHNLAAQLRSLGEYDEARALGKLALATFESELGPDHVWTLRAMAGEAAVLKAVGEFAEAEAVQSRLLGSTRAIFGDDASDTARCLQDLAQVHRETGRNDDAEREMREALAIYARIGAERSIASAIVQRQIAGLLEDTGRAVEAEPLARAAVDTLRELTGPQSDDYREAIVVLAFVRKKLGRIVEAEQGLREALEIERQRLGPDNPFTLVALENLANCLLDRGDARSAEAMVSEVLERRRKTLGEEHPAVARSRFNLACAKRDLGDLAAAKELFTAALDQFRRQLAPTHPNVLAGMRELVALDLKLEDLDGAELLQRDLLDQVVAVNGAAHVTTVRESRRLASILVARGQHEEAAELLQRAWDAAVVLTPRDAVLLREIKQELVNLYTAADDAERASEWRARVAPPAPGS